MKQQQFEQKYADSWQRYSQALKELERPQIANNQTTMHNDFLAMYRDLCQQLALARDRHYTPTLLRRLNHLALSGQAVLYGKRSIMLQKLLDFFLHDFPASVRREWRWVLVSTLLFFGVWLVAMLAALVRPELVYSVLGPSELASMESMYGPRGDDMREARTFGMDVQMFGFYIWNNIGIGFRMLAAFVLFGFGPILMLVQQGVMFGAITAHMINQGFSTAFFGFTSGHSSWELLAIMLAGAVGIKLGWSLLVPGQFTRSGALKHTIQQALPLIYGLFFMLFVAAAVEGFWSSTDALPPVLRYCVGLSFWALIISYFFLAGRSRWWWLPALIGATLLSGLVLVLRALSPSDWTGYVLPCILAFGGWFTALALFNPARSEPSSKAMLRIDDAENRLNEAST